MPRANIYHIPILLEEVISGLNIKAEGLYIDATLGGGGHTEEMLKHGGRVLGLDRDDDALDYSKNRLKSWIDNKRVSLVKANFDSIEKIGKEHGFIKIDGILFDLGLSSNQLNNSGRGFTFRKNEALDMRMDSKSDVTAEKIIKTYSKGELYDTFSTYAEEIDSRNVSESIIHARKIKKIQTTEDLISSLNIDSKNINNIKTITRVFQALRIEVNDELNNLKKAIPQAYELLNKGGRVAFISFHSLEDRIVKLAMKKYAMVDITKKPITASENEIKNNSRARSAKLRIYEKI